MYASKGGLDQAWLDIQPKDKHLGRLAAKLTMEETRQLYMCLKAKEPDQSWKVICDNYNRMGYGFEIKFYALRDWKLSTRNSTFKHLQQNLMRVGIDSHKLCQILREVQTDSDLAAEKLYVKPSRSDMTLLQNHIGQTEDVLDKWRKHHQATYDVLAKTLYRLNLSGILEYLTYEIGLKDQLKDRINDNREEIIRNIVNADIIDHMMTQLVISADDRRRIEQHAGQDDQNKVLLDIVMKRREPSYSVFVGLSSVTDQHYKVRLQKNYSEIICNIIHESIVDRLIECDVLSIDDRQKIEAGQSQKEKNRKLMDNLLHMRECKKGYTEFIKALGADSTYTDLARQIDNTEVTSNDLLTFERYLKSAGND
ncbi:unnamed protein product [Mytilus coruscus]|uniref:CARD domain-containing protein n=1 Tax=Mytilus coruscus TaxID=42192 RepID=A0A6J8C7Z2_MYTCO|nr:unnamed protein product [Mytilus coruscus]